MCGIIATIGKHGMTDTHCSAALKLIGHRGPDGQRTVNPVNNPVCLGHCRLKVIDLSDQGAQPMTSSDGRYTICFNGEIYNYQEIAKDLKEEGISLQTHSDTEVLLYAFALWGVDVLSKIHGMFAFVFYDMQKQTITLVRDRFGVKPLYYTLQDDTVYVSSELKGIVSFSNIQKKINPTSLQAYFRYGYVVQPDTIFLGIHQLPAGSYATFLVHEVMSLPLEPRVWFSPKQKDSTLPKITDETTAKKAVMKAIKKSIAYRLVADAPVGIMFSGGIDSTAIALLAQQQSDKPVHTYTIGFDQKESEHSHAAHIAKSLGTIHHEKIITASDVLAVIDDVVEQFDEPFADSSALATYILARWMREDVTVALSGDGGDEFFAGYEKYRALSAMYTWSPITRWMIHHITRPHIIPLLVWANTILRFFGKGVSNATTKFQKLHELTDPTRGASMWWDTLQTVWSDEELHAIGLFVTSDTLPSTLLKNQSTQAMQLADISQYLSSDILVKTDRATMAVGLEGREPLLDQDIWSTYNRIAPSLHIGKSPKWILRELITSSLKEQWVNKPKTGFTPPIAQWLQGPLADEFSFVTSQSFIEAQGLFSYDELKKILPTTTGWKYVRADKWWTFFMFQRWYQRWMMS